MNIKLANKNLLSRYLILNILIVCMLFFVVISNHAFAADRFSPPSLSTPVNGFNRRFTADNFNADFIVAHVLNNARQAERTTTDTTTKLVVNQTKEDSFNTDGALSNSVVIPSGIKVETIIIINQNEGDSFAIQR